MRTAVIRIDVDPAGELPAAGLADGMFALRRAAATVAAEVVDRNGSGGIEGRREITLLIDTDDADLAVQELTAICASSFGTDPTAGAVTYISRGTDDDARGVLAGFGLSGDITRSVDADGFDVVGVTLRDSDLERVPESRIHTAIEASLNCEVVIATR